MHARAPDRDFKRKRATIGAHALRLIYKAGANVVNRAHQRDAMCGDGSAKLSESVAM